MFVLAVLLSVGGGLALAVQGPTNTALATHIGNAESTLVSFALGALVLGLATGAFGTGNLAALTGVAPWQLLGGVYGAALVLGITYAVAALGAALTLTVIMLGQMLTGLVVDSFGLLQTQVIALSPLRIVGLVVVFAGIALIYVARMRTDDATSREGRRRSSSAIMLVVAFGVGVLCALQAPTNTALATHVGSVEASFVSFSVGTLVILVYALIVTRGHLQPLKGIPVWQLIGGLYGAANVLFVIIANPYLGVSLTMATVMLGQLAMGVAIDSFGWFAMPKRRFNVHGYAGLVCIAAGIVVISCALLA